MRLRCMGGLANKLRALFSYRSVYCREPEGLKVEWLPEQCGGHFLDAFEPLSGVTFVEPGPWTIRHEGGPVLVEGDRIVSNEWAVKSELLGHADEPTWADYNPLADARFGWQADYKELRLRAEVRERLPPKPYYAMHIRRTDHTEMARSWGVHTPESAFTDWSMWMDGDLYVATDNARTQLQWRKCRSRVLISDIIYSDSQSGEARNTTISHAAIDLFACVRAASFKGSGGSSFTALIETLRAMPGGWWQE